VSNKIEIDDAIVLLLGTKIPGAREGEISGITRLEKLIFLLERETGSAEWLDQKADFEPYNFGPYSSLVYQAIDLLSSANLIEDTAAPATDDSDTWESREKIGLAEGASVEPDRYTTRDFKLTERGWRYFSALTAELSPAELAEIAEFKRRFAFLPLRQLIRYVYKKYEEFTTKSIIRDDILGSES
jgi:hypothetical protein